MKRNKYYCLSYKYPSNYKADLFHTVESYIEFRGNKFRALVQIEDGEQSQVYKGTTSIYSSKTVWRELRLLDLHRMSSLEDKTHHPAHLEIEFLPVTKKEIMLKKICN